MYCYRPLITFIHTYTYYSNTMLECKSKLSQIAPVSEKRHEMILSGVEWAYLWGLQWIMWIEWKKSSYLNKTYTGKNLMLLRGLRSALSTMPTGFLEEGMFSLLAKGPNLLPQCKQSPLADWNLDHMRACQGTCNNRIDKQSDMHTDRHIQAL